MFWYGFVDLVHLTFGSWCSGWHKLEFREFVRRLNLPWLGWIFGIWVSFRFDLVLWLLGL